MGNFDYKKYLDEGRLLKEEDDGYDKASRELFDMTWDEVRKQDDPRMRQDVHDEVQKDDEADWGDDVDESVTGSKEKFNVIVKNTGEIIDDGLPKDLALKLAAKKNGWAIKKVSESVNEEEYPSSAPRVYVVMLGNKGGPVGPYRVYADKSTAEAEAAQQKENSKQLGSDIRAFVQDLAYIK